MSNTFNEKIEHLFFGKLANKLEELYPKHISKERSTALVFNAYANIIFKEVIQTTLQDFLSEILPEEQHFDWTDTGFNKCRAETKDRANNFIEKI